MAKLSVTRGQTPAERARFALAETPANWRINCWANWPAQKPRRRLPGTLRVYWRKVRNGKVLSAAILTPLSMCRSAERVAGSAGRPSADPAGVAAPSAARHG